MPKHFTEPFPFDLYLPEGPGPHPLVCITPLLGRLMFLEDLFFERRFARYFSQRGLAAAVIGRPIFDFNPALGLGQIHGYLENMLERNRKVLDKLLTFKEIDASRLATFGISFGAVINCLWAASDKRFRAHALALGGGDLTEIFMTSRDPLMRSYYTAALESVGGDRRRLESSLRETFKLDPLDAAKELRDKKILLALAVFDRVIRFSNGMALRRALGKPETVFLPLGHVTAILAIPALRRRVARFLKRELGV